tara:strand:- start:1283 stop:2086 length:804 start_codon:yes stop_codon:yes gene_type:complete
VDLRRLAWGSEVQLFNKDINSMIGEIVRVGRYCARFALSKDDLLAAQELRYRCFNLSNDKGLDVDEFDPICRHVLVENLENGKLICCYRIMRFPDGKDITRSYSSRFYDLGSIENFPKPMIEVGRFCIDPVTTDHEVVLAAWAALTQLVDENGIEFLFGCSSFEGIDKEKYLHCFAFLREKHIAPEHWLPRVKAAQVISYSKANCCKVNKKKALLNMPPLLKSYLSMGAWVSDHAVIDYSMKTLHLFTGVEVSKIPSRRKQFLRNLA